MGSVAKASLLITICSILIHNASHYWDYRLNNYGAWKCVPSRKLVYFVALRTKLFRKLWCWKTKFDYQINPQVGIIHMSISGVKSEIIYF